MRSAKRQGHQILLAASMVSMVHGSIHAFSVFLEPLETAFASTLTHYAADPWRQGTLCSFGFSGTNARAFGGRRLRLRGDNRNLSRSHCHTIPRRRWPTYLWPYFHGVGNGRAVGAMACWPNLQLGWKLYACSFVGCRPWYRLCWHRA